MVREGLELIPQLFRSDLHLQRSYQTRQSRNLTGPISCPSRSICLFFGTRPEAIKMAPVLRAFQGDSHAECVVCVTGQHEELLLNPVFFAFSNQAGLSFARNVTQPEALQPNCAAIDRSGKSDCAGAAQLGLVQGDTTSAMAGALAACSKVSLESSRLACDRTTSSGVSGRSESKID